MVEQLATLSRKAEEENPSTEAKSWATIARPKPKPMAKKVKTSGGFFQNLWRNFTINAGEVFFEKDNLFS